MCLSFLRKQESSLFCVSPSPYPLDGQGRGENIASSFG